eukprot:5266863-Alexandrium_andersonii.AAC.1
MCIRDRSINCAGSAAAISRVPAGSSRGQPTAPLPCADPRTPTHHLKRARERVLWAHFQHTRGLREYSNGAIA